MAPSRGEVPIAFWVGGGLAILATQCIFKAVFLPAVPPGVHLLAMNPVIFENVHRLLTGDWTQLFVPYAYEPGRYYWSTSAIVFTYLAEKHFGPVGSYLFFSGLFVGVSFVMAAVVTRSLVFAATMAFMFGFGTQLDYVLTYGNLTALYLVLSYIAINFALAVLMIQGRISIASGLIAFTLSLVVVAVSNEMWINYATAMIAASAFGTIWARHLGDYTLVRRSATILTATTAVLLLYLVVRLRLVNQYLKPGAEEELLFAYGSVVLFIEDAIVNFFTLMYTTLDNYLPSFVSSSNSLTYLGSKAILAEQHGYDAANQQFVVLSHLYLWRFYAGVLVTIFLGFTGWVLIRAWQAKSIGAAAAAALALMILAGFATHLSIKMRPYNSVPALPYKAIISISAWTILVAYLTTCSAARLRTARARYSLVAAVWLCVFLAALTRPEMQNRLLSEVGLVGRGDPLGQLLNWFR